MKNNIFFTGLIFALSAAFTANAQSSDPAIKILPAAEQGTVKLIYAHDSKNAVVVKFLDENGLLKTDHVKAGSFQNGFLKKYDISRIQANTLWVEVSSGDLTVRYKLMHDQLGRFVPYLEQTTYNHPMVATIN
jgi:hypothetical protein